jgi:hypothetical protein
MWSATTGRRPHACVKEVSTMMQASPDAWIVVADADANKSSVDATRCR